MPDTLEKFPTATDSGNDNIIPPVYTAERGDDGEGDGRWVAAGVETAEDFANNGTVRELSGVHIAEVAFGFGRERMLRNRASIPTGRLAVRREIPIILN